ncbi:Molybdenum cofactor synthesis protein 1 [Chytriomyces hyalinus]|nr:Molybdenum cofactor synthesis protein 1 [Chytriomyces hyalinus]
MPPPAKMLTNSLRDSFGRTHNYLRISLTEKCNLRFVVSSALLSNLRSALFYSMLCTYCMPAAGVPDLTPSSKLLTGQEILQLASVFVKQLGVQKIRLTGGEPTIRKDLLQIVEGLNALKPYGLKSIGITTNGLALKSKLQPLKDAGLDQINISLDTLDPPMFELLTRRRGHQSVLDTIHASLETGFSAVKVNTVVMNGVNDHEVPAFVEMTRNNNLYVRFIEYMPFSGNQWSSRKFVPYKTLLGNIQDRYPDRNVVKCTDDANDTSKSYRVMGGSGAEEEAFIGKFGFITSMSEHFCGTCSRVRLLADGNLKVCLFGDAEVNLKDVLRNSTGADAAAIEEEVIQVIREAVMRKKEKHAGMDKLAGMKNRPMVLIGG